MLDAPNQLLVSGESPQAERIRRFPTPYVFAVWPELNVRRTPRLVGTSRLSRSRYVIIFAQQMSVMKDARAIRQRSSTGEICISSLLDCSRHYLLERAESSAGR